MSNSNFFCVVSCVMWCISVALFIGVTFDSDVLAVVKMFRWGIVYAWHKCLRWCCDELLSVADEQTADSVLCRNCYVHTVGSRWRECGLTQCGDGLVRLRCPLVLTAWQLSTDRTIRLRQTDTVIAWKVVHVDEPFFVIVNKWIVSSQSAAVYRRD